MGSSGRGAADRIPTVHVWPAEEESEHEFLGSDCCCDPFREVQNGNLLVQHNRFRPGEDLWKCGFSARGRPANFSVHLSCRSCGYSWSAHVLSKTGESIYPDLLPTNVVVECPDCGEVAATWG